VVNWQEYAWQSDEQLERVPVELLNAACAAKLPNAEWLDLPLCTRKLDFYATCVRRYTDECLSCFRQQPHEYNHSEAYFRVLCLVTVLQRDFGIRYNPAKIPEDVPLDAADVFIHGVLQGAGGTCASMPVVYAAVGRRLGYPIRLVSAMDKRREIGHLFCRWDDPNGERFNIEATNKGLTCDPDDFYRTGRFAVTPEEEWHGCLLKSMTPREELAGFLAERGHCWLDLKRYHDACNCFAFAWALHPANVLLQNRLISTMNAWGAEVMLRQPPGFPVLRHQDVPRFFPDSLPADYEHDLLDLQARDDILRNEECERRWWGPMRQGRPVARPPRMIEIRPSGGHMDLTFRFDPVEPQPPAPKRNVRRWYDPVRGHWRPEGGVPTNNPYDLDH
jgi:hypothetical protein